MVKKAKGIRSKTRQLFSRRNREKTSVNKKLRNFKIGSRVVIKADSSENKGRPFKRFYGKSGIIVDKRGRSYIVKIKDRNKEKDIISSPVHLKEM